MKGNRQNKNGKDRGRQQQPQQQHQAQQKRTETQDNSSSNSNEKRLPKVSTEVGDSLFCVNPRLFEPRKDLIEFILSSKKVGERMQFKEFDRCMATFNDLVQRQTQQIIAERKKAGLTDGASTDLSASLLTGSVGIVSMLETTKDEKDYFLFNYWKTALYSIYFLCDAPTKRRVLGLYDVETPESMRTSDAMKNFWVDKVHPELRRLCTAKLSAMDFNMEVTQIARTDKQSCLDFLQTVTRLLARGLKDFKISHPDVVDEAMAAVDSEPYSVAFSYVKPFFTLEEHRVLKAHEANTLAQALEICERTPRLIGAETTGSYSATVPAATTANQQPRGGGGKDKEEKSSAASAATNTVANNGGGKKDPSRNCSVCKKTGPAGLHWDRDCPDQVKPPARIPDRKNRSGISYLAEQIQLAVDKRLAAVKPANWLILEEAATTSEAAMTATTITADEVKDGGKQNSKQDGRQEEAPTCSQEITCSAVTRAMRVAHQEKVVYGYLEVGGARVLGLIDTGSGMSFVSSEIQSEMDVPSTPTGRVTVRGIGGYTSAPTQDAPMAVGQGDRKAVVSSSVAIVPRSRLPQSKYGPVDLLLSTPDTRRLNLDVNHNLYGDVPDARDFTGPNGEIAATAADIKWPLWIKQRNVVPVLATEVFTATLADGEVEGEGYVDSFGGCVTTLPCYATVSVPNPHHDGLGCGDVESSQPLAVHFHAHSDDAMDANEVWTSATPFGRERGEAKVGPWTSRSWSAGLIGASSSAYSAELVESYQLSRDAKEREEGKEKSFLAVIGNPAFVAAEECFISESVLNVIMDKRRTHELGVMQRILTEEEMMRKGSTDGANLSPALFGEMLDLIKEAAEMKPRGGAKIKVISDTPGCVRADIWAPVKLELKSEFQGTNFRPPKCGRPKWGTVTAQVLSAWAKKQVLLGLGEIWSHEQVRFASRALIHCPNPEAAYPKIRVCVDVREINALLVKHISYAPSPDDIRDALKGRKFYTTMDQTGAFNQVRLDPETGKMFGVWVPDGIFVPTRMFFGGEPFPSIMQAINTKILCQHPAWGTDLFCYMDDIIIGSNDFKRHLTVVREVIGLFADAGMTLSPAKFRCGHSKANVLGHLVSEEGSHLSEEHKQAIRDISFPENDKECASVLGLFLYYWKHTSKYAELARVIRTLDLPREVRYAAFEELRDALIESPMLVSFDPEKELVADVDANNKRIAGVLAHRFNGIEHPILFFSYAWDETQQRWVIYVRELFGLVFCIDKCRTYFNASKHVPLIRVDHKPLLWVKHASSPMVVKWLLEYVQDVDFRIEYRPGVAHINADGLTRVPMTTMDTPTAAGLVLCWETLIDSEALPTLGGQERYLLYAGGQEGILERQAHRILVGKGLAKRPPLVIKPGGRALEDPDWTFAIVTPTAEQFTKVAYDLFKSYRPFAVLGPSDLVHLVEQDISDSGDPAQKAKWKRCVKLSFLSDNLCWLVVGGAVIPDAVYCVEDGLVSPCPALLEELGYGPAAELVYETESVRLPLPFDRLALLQAQRDEDQRLKAEVLKEEGVRLAADGLLVYGDENLPYIPSHLRTKLLEYVHRTNDHAGRDGMNLVLKALVYWRGRDRDVQEYCSKQRCSFCALKNARRTLKEIAYQSIQPTGPADYFIMDCFGPYDPPDKDGNRYVWTGFNPWNAMEYAQAVQEQNKQTATDFLLFHVIYGTNGHFRCLVTDASRILTGTLLQGVCDDLQISRLISSSYSAWVLGMVERRHLELGNWLKSLNADDHKVHGKLLPVFLFERNNRRRAEIQVSAHELRFGCQLPTALSLTLAPQLLGDEQVDVAPSPAILSARVLQVRRAVEAYSPLAQEVQTRRQDKLDRANAGKLPHVYAQGDVVLIYRRSAHKGQSLKLRFQWTGPYRVLRQVGNNAYDLEDTKTKVVVKSSTPHMHLYKGDVKLMEAYIAGRKAHNRSIISSRWDVLENDEDLGATLMLGDFIAVHDTDAGPGSGLYRFGEILEIDEDAGEVQIHICPPAQPVARQVDPIFRAAYIERKATQVRGEAKGVKRKQTVLKKVGEKRPGGCDPWTGHYEFADIFATGLQLLKTGKLDKGSREVLAGLEATELGRY